MDPITGLAYGRIAIGALSFVSPATAARMFLLDPVTNPQLAPVTRMFGAREVALGAITLASSGAARRNLVQVGLAVDAADVVTGLAAAASGATRKRAGLALAAVAAGAVASGAAALQDS